MSTNDFIGMPPSSNGVPPGDRLSNTEYTKTPGDVVDNTSGANLANGTESGKPVKNDRGGAGKNLKMYSKPSWLCSK